MRFRDILMLAAQSGGKAVPVIPGYVTNESLSLQTTTTPSLNGAAITTTLAASTNYLFFWSQDVQTTSTASNAGSNLTIGGTSVFTTQPAMTPSVGTDYFSEGGFIRYQSGGSPSSTTFQLIATSSNAATLNLQNSRLSYLKMGPSDVYAESIARQTFSNPTTAQVAATLSFTPGTTGDYVILLSCNVDLTNSTNVTFGLELTDGTNTTGVITLRPNQSSVMPVMLMLPLSAVSGSRTLSVKVSQPNSGSATCGISEIRLVAIRSDRFNNVNTTVLASSSSGTQTSFTSVLSQSPTMAASTHLVLATAAFGNNDASVSQMRFTDGGTTVNAAAQKIGIFVATQAHPFVSTRMPTYSAGSVTQEIDRLSGSGSSTTTVQAKATAIVVYDLAGIT